MRAMCALHDSGVTLTPNQPSPTSPTRRSAGALSPPKMIGGCGRWTGLGYDRTLGKLQNSPLNSDSSSVHSIFMTFRYSRVRWARRSQGTPSAVNSSASQPTPTPKSKRPPDSLSRLATSLAVTSGLRSGTRQMPVPSRRVLVCAAAYVSAANGSRKSICIVGMGILPSMEYGYFELYRSSSTTCSGAHSE